MQPTDYCPWGYSIIIIQVTVAWREILEGKTQKELPQCWVAMKSFSRWHPRQKWVFPSTVRSNPCPIPSSDCKTSRWSPSHRRQWWRDKNVPPAGSQQRQGGSKGQPLPTLRKRSKVFGDRVPSRGAAERRGGPGEPAPAPNGSPGTCSEPRVSAAGCTRIRAGWAESWRSSPRSSALTHELSRTAGSRGDFGQAPSVSGLKMVLICETCIARALISFVRIKFIKIGKSV